MTYASIQSLKPDLIINAGTAGGFKVMFQDITCLMPCCRFIVPGF